MPTTTPKPPVGRRTGKPPEHASKLGGIYTSIAEEAEDVPELRHPESVVVYDKIAKSSQVSPLLRLLKQPIRNYQFEVDPGNADPKAIAQAAHVLGIPMKGEQDGKRARARRVEFINRTLRATTLGHAVFEIEGEKTAGGGWALRKLHYLSPRSLWRWQFVGDTSDVDFIEQSAPSGTLKLDRGRLAIIRYDADPDYPYGESILRPLYENWLRHDRLARISLVAAERNGMGIPFGTGAEGAVDGDIQTIQEFVESVAAGEETGGSGPVGSTFDLVGVKGKTFPLLEHMKYEDESASKVLGGQILNLGTSQTGSRSVGDNHAELLWGSRDALVESAICEPLAVEVLHRVALWTGHDPNDVDGLPSIEATRPTVVEPLGPDDWAALEAAGWLNASDEGQRREFERRYNVPASERGSVGSGSGEPEPTPPSVVAAAAATDTGLVKGVPQARRKLNAIEQASHWPFAALQSAWVETRDQLAALWALTRRQMITAATADLATLEALHDRVDELHDLARTAALATLTPQTVSLIADAADRLAEQAANLTRGAVAAQGLTTEAVPVGYAEQATRSARAAGQTIALTVADQVARSAARVAAPGVPSVQVAALVEQDLSTLTDALPRKVAGAEATRAQHAGQAAVIEPIWESTDIASAYYSSLLDGATCGPCARRDGHRYEDMAAVRKDFPSGGYLYCEGDDACRCTWVFVLASEMPVGVDDTRSAA